MFKSILVTLGLLATLGGKVECNQISNFDLLTNLVFTECSGVDDYIMMHSTYMDYKYKILDGNIFRYDYKIERKYKLYSETDIINELMDTYDYLETDTTGDLKWKIYVDYKTTGILDKIDSILDNIG